jgi:hypothetical protein
MHSHGRKLAGAALAAGLILLASCASLQHSWDQGNVQTVARLINEGQADTLAAMSAVPFLVDGEIVTLKPDIASFWSGIVKAGFKVEGATLVQAAPLAPGSYTQFANTMEVKTFFAQYVKKEARLLELGTSRSGKKIMLIFSDSSFKKTIYGFKGPY